MTSPQNKPITMQTMLPVPSAGKQANSAKRGKTANSAKRGKTCCRRQAQENSKQCQT